jgi:hypothetical protein
MEFDVGYVIAGIDLVVGLVILYLASITAHRLKGSTLYWTAVLFLITGVLFVVHAAVELAGLGEGLYGVTALVATLMLAFTMVIIDITISMLGVKA